MLPTLVVGVLLAEGCGGDAASGSGEGTDSGGTEGGRQLRTLTIEQARDRAQQHIDRAVAALPVTPELTLHRDDELECTDPDDNGPAGRYQVGRTYWLDRIPTERSAEIVDTLHGHWTSGGFRVLADERASDDRFVSVEHGEDAFRMSVQQSKDGSLSLGASSPCVWPDGEPPGDAEAPAGSGH
ncbi:hypothetical protein LY12_003167 [Prauserella alba]|uniref:Lipoprotein n=1 Tax=Prauserella alba TaxID=176898 RepID=A0ABP4G6N6_9PSEU|nr:hypothetical protein [Prauserella alba]